MKINLWKTSLFLFFCLSLLVFSQASFAYDDPAIVVYEEIAKLDVPPRGKYKRIDSRIEGTSVTIFYEVAILTTKPRQFTKRCVFSFDNNLNRFVFSPKTSDDKKFNECQEKIAKGEAISEKLIREKDIESLDKQIAILEQCKAYFKSQMLRRLDEMKMLTSLGITGIKPDETALKAQ